MGTFSDLSDFMVAVMRYWFFLMGGIVSVLITFWEKVKHNSIASYIFYIIAICCIFTAFFFAWKDEHNKLKDLQAKMESPAFGGYIGSITDGELNGQPFLVVGGLITNPTGPPSGISSWKLIIEFPNGKRMLGIVPLISVKDIEILIPSGQGHKIVLPINQYWPKITTNPIPTAGALEGWFWSTFPGLDLDEAYKEHALVVLEIRDVITNKPHIFTKKLGKGGIQLPAGTIPSH